MFIVFDVGRDVTTAHDSNLQTMRVIFYNLSQNTYNTTPLILDSQNLSIHTSFTVRD